MSRSWIVGAVVAIFVVAFGGIVIEGGVIVWAILHPRQVAHAAGSLAGDAAKAFNESSQ